jgi:2-keto-4-pentenoate hydratase
VSDERIARGMQRQLELRAGLLAEGATHLGWKVGLNAPPVQQQLGIDGPVAGFLTDATLLADGGDFLLPAGIASVCAEPEVGVQIGADGVSIAAVMPALEIVHFDRPLDQLEDMLAEDIFHRGVVLGPRGSGPAQAARVLVSGEQRHALAIEADLDQIVLTVAERLAEAGEQLHPGDVIITGTLVPPIEVGAGDRVRLELDPLGAVDIALAA